MKSPMAPLLSFAVLFGLGGLVYAAGVGPPARAIPYTGYLERDGNPVSETDIPFVFRLFDGAQGTGEAELYSSAADIDVNAGTFTVVLGRDTASLPDSVFEAAELFVQVEIGGAVVGARRQIWALPQAVRAGEAVDFVASGQISAASADLGETTVSTLHVTEHAFGVPFSPALNTNITMATDAFVTFDVLVNANEDGPRAKIEILVNGVAVASDSVHKFSGSDAFVPHGSCSTAVRRGDTVRFLLSPSVGLQNAFTARTRVVPFAP